MKRTAAILLALVMALSLIACTGSSDPKSSDPNLGLYEATTMEYMGFSVGVSDLFEQGFSIELKANGKCVLNADGKTANGKWTLDGRDFTVKGGGLDCTGTLENGVILLQYDDDVTITLVNGSYRAPTAVPTAQTEKQTEPAKTDPIEPNQQTEAGQQGAQTVSESNEFWITEYEANGMKYEGDALKTTGLDQTYLRLNDDHTGYLMMMGDGFEIGWDEKNLTIAGVPMYSYEYLDADTIRLSMYETILFTLKRKTGESPAQQGAPAATEAPKTTEAPAAEAAGDGAPYGDSDGVIARAKLAGLYRWLNSMDSDFWKVISFNEVSNAAGKLGCDTKKNDGKTASATWSDGDRGIMTVTFRNRDTGWSVSSIAVSGVPSSEYSTADLSGFPVYGSGAPAGSSPVASVTLKGKVGFSGPEVAVTAKVPTVNWTAIERSRAVRYASTPNPDNAAYASSYLSVEFYESLEKINFYLDSFTNLTELEGRTIGGIPMAGRSYSNIGMDWIEYYGELSEGVWVSVKLTGVDFTAGTETEAIVNSLSFSLVK